MVAFAPTIFCLVLLFQDTVSAKDIGLHIGNAIIAPDGFNRRYVWYSEVHTRSDVSSSAIVVNGQTLGPVITGTKVSILSYSQSVTLTFLMNRGTG